MPEARVDSVGLLNSIKKDKHSSAALVSLLIMSNQLTVKILLYELVLSIFNL